MQRNFKTIFCVFRQYGFFLWIALLWRSHAFNNMSGKQILEFGVEKRYINYLFVFISFAYVLKTCSIKESLQSFTFTSSLKTICANIDFSNSIITSRYECQKVLSFEVRMKHISSNYLSYRYLIFIYQVNKQYASTSIRFLFIIKNKPKIFENSKK